MKCLSAFLASALLFVAYPAQGAEVPYTAGDSRDPFATLLQRKKVAPGPEAGEHELRSLVVQGIVATPSNPRAIVNGKIYKIGSSILPGIRITRIEKEGLFVMIGEKETLLSRPTQPTKGKSAQ